MRIAMYENLPPGGAKRTAYEFGRQLAQRHSVDLYRLSIASTGTFDLSPLAAQVYEYDYSPFFGLLNRRLAQGRLAPRSATLFYPLLRLHRQIARDLVARGYDAVLAHTDAMTQSPYLLRWIGGVGLYYCHEVLRVGRERAVMQAHRQDLRRSRPPVGAVRVLEDSLVMSGWLRADRRTVAAAGRIAVNSVYTREQVFAAYGREATVCSPGVDPVRFAPSDTQRDPEILSIGSPFPIKGHDLVIRALALLPLARRPHLRVIAGTHDGSDALQALAQGLGVELVVETAIDDATLVRRYQSAMATVCAARLEPFGLTALESMACATPVIAIHEAGFRETVLDGETGILVEPRPEDLAGAIGTLAGDPALARRLGRAGRAAVLDRWSWEARTHALEAALQQPALREPRT
jgi:glycosyltransferase involved in cell wall biosynthesis